MLYGSEWLLFASMKCRDSLSKRLEGFYEKGKVGLIYATPWLIGFLLLTAWPILSSFYYSLTDYSLARVGQTPAFRHSKLCESL